MLVTSEPEFEAYCKENYILADDMNIVSDADEDTDGGYFSNIDLPVEQMNEVSDDWFMSHLMDDTATVSCKV